MTSEMGKPPNKQRVGRGKSTKFWLPREPLPPGPPPNHTPTYANPPWWNTGGRTRWTQNVLLSVVYGRIFPSGNQVLFSRWVRKDGFLKGQEKSSQASGDRLHFPGSTGNTEVTEPEALELESFFVDAAKMEQHDASSSSGRNESHHPSAQASGARLQSNRR